MLIPINASLAQPIYLQIADHVTALARAGQLQANDRLPSTRQMADDLGVHRSTVVNAYDELQARGVLISMHGSGSYIADGLAQSNTPKLAASPQWLSADNAQLVTQLWKFNVTDGMLNLALALPADELIPLEALEQARARVVRREQSQSLVYMEPQGHAPLRRAIARDVSRHGIQCDADDIIITCGAQEAVALTARALATNGDTAMVEAPFFFGSLMALQRFGLKLLTFGREAMGPNWADLKAQINETPSHPRFVLAVPDYHNPTGLLWSASERYQFLRWASEQNIPVIEDATYIDTRLEGNACVPLRALDPEVIYVGSMSKSLSPGLRIGYIIANGKLRDQLITLKHITSGSSEALSQRALADYLMTDAYTQHLEHIALIYRRRRDAALQAMSNYFPADVHWTTPLGGYSIWVTLPPRIDAMALFERALNYGVVIGPAKAFYPEGATDIANAFRICFARHTEEALAHAVRVLGGVMERRDGL